MVWLGIALKRLIDCWLCLLFANKSLLKTIRDLLQWERPALRLLGWHRLLSEAGSLTPKSMGSSSLT